MMKKQRAMEKQEQYREERDTLFGFKDFDTFNNILNQEQKVVTDTDTSIETPQKARFMESLL